MNPQTTPNQPQKTKSKKFLGDAILIGSIALVAVLAALCLLLFRTQGDTVVVEIDGKLFGTYALTDDTRVEIPSGEGQMNVLVIRDGEAYVESATCPDGICAAHRPISHDGEQIVCLPHRVVITVKKAAEKTPDMIA